MSLAVDVPPAIEADHDRHDRAVAAMKSLTRDHALAGSFVAAVVTAFANNTDPVDDPDVRRLIVTDRIADHSIAVPEHSAQRLEDTYRDHADDLIVALRSPFDAAARDLADAHEILGDVDLDDSDAIVRRGPDAAEAWAAATTAAMTTGVATDCWRHLYRLATRRAVEARYRPLLLADLPAAAAVDAVDTPVDGGVDAWYAVRHGWKLALPTHEQYHDRIAAIATERQARAAAAEKASKDDRIPWQPWQ